jgi:hypothetical protein
MHPDAGRCIQWPRFGVAAAPLGREIYFELSTLAVRPGFH